MGDPVTGNAHLASAPMTTTTFVRQALKRDDERGMEDHLAVGELTAMSWRGSVPEALLSSYAVAQNAINDAPSDEADTFQWSARSVRDFEKAVAARNREMHVTVLLDGDQVVAFTEIRVSRQEHAVAFTEDTAVRRDYRGRGPAKRLKAASLREPARHRPDVRYVTTTNESSNAPMLAVNRAAGFIPVATRRQIGRDIS